MTPPNFDRIASSYRWLEYLTLGRSLERCRLHFLPKLLDRTRALVLGDGDGRFLAALLSQNTALKAEAVDTSAAMLSLLSSRCQRTAPAAESRLTIHRSEALRHLAGATQKTYDLVITHFFLDCLTQGEVETLVKRVSQRLTPGAVWLISDFRVPPGVMSYPAILLVRSLYFAFRILTGLRTTRLPQHAEILTPTFTQTASSQFLFGLLTTELWTFNGECPVQRGERDNISPVH